MKRWDIINTLIKKYNFKNYLEIGVYSKQNFNEIIAETKTGVDPNVQTNYIMTSDDFFKDLSLEKRYDIVFIDGLHIAEQVERDIENSLKHLDKDGIIVCHDCNPTQENYQEDHVISADGVWLGTVWKTWAKFRCTRKDLEMHVVDTDWGCGIIKRGTQELYKQNVTKFDWDFLEKNRKDILNLISIEEFINSI